MSFGLVKDQADAIVGALEISLRKPDLKANPSILPVLPINRDRHGDDIVIYSFWTAIYQNRQLEAPVLGLAGLGFSRRKIA